MSKKRDIRRGVEHLLGILGEDLGTVVRSLEAHGVRGTPKDPKECALSRYLNAVIGSDPAIAAVQVRQDRVQVDWSSRLRVPMVVRLPDPLVQFVLAFDRGRFPHLVAGSDNLTSDPGRPRSRPPDSPAQSDQAS